MTTTSAQVFPTLKVDDITAAVDYYITQLGFSLKFTWGDPPTYAGVDLGSVTIHLAKGTPFVKGYSEINFVIDNADEQYEFHRSNGVEIVSPIEDQPYGLRDYKIKDLYGNYIGFGHYIYSQGPPLKIERVDVPVRLEKRLAALLEDDGYRFVE